MTEEIIKFDLGDVELLSGEKLTSAVLVAKTWGRLSAARDNVIVLPTYYTGTHGGYAPLVGPGNVFDANHYFVVSPNLFGNGLSTSPSNAIETNSGPRFPQVDVYDNALCPYPLVTPGLVVTDIQLVAGPSMCTTQAFVWPVAFQSLVRRLSPVSCSPYRPLPN